MKVREKTHENIKPSWVYDQEKLICCYKFRHGEKCLFCDKREHLLKCMENGKRRIHYDSSVLFVNRNRKHGNRLKV